MKKKSKVIIVSTLSMICLCVLGSFIPAVTARDSFAPSWLKEGAYVTYICKEENIAYVFNVTDPRFEGLNYLYPGPSRDTIIYLNASLTWRCISVNATMAKLQVTFDYIGKELQHFEGETLIRTSLNGESLQRTGEAYVDLYTRAVYNANGVLLGTTHLWLPANPSDGQEIVVWDAPPKTITLPIRIESGHETIQGPQDIFDSEPNSYKIVSLFYDLDTGLAVDGAFKWDPIMAAIGIDDSGLVGDGHPNTAFFDTNINFGPERTTINWMQILQYSILPIAVVLLLVAFVIRRKKKRN
jgi:hypothetical protein